MYFDRIYLDKRTNERMNERTDGWMDGWNPYTHTHTHFSFSYNVFGVRGTHRWVGSLFPIIHSPFLPLSVLFISAWTCSLLRSPHSIDSPFTPGHQILERRRVTVVHSLLHTHSHTHTHADRRVASNTKKKKKKRKTVISHSWDHLLKYAFARATKKIYNLLNALFTLS